ncbi:tyrosine--tRNA ligase [Patescibacteria group bacterium]|nr:tyrosine--tRNA ligase [Patescibacteria group bacterium]
MTIDEVLTRGVAEILPSKEGLAEIMAKRKITLYQGFDPTSPKLHIGHMIGLRKLAQFQKLGHKVIFLIGDFTGMIGDPTDKTAARHLLTREEILKNLEDYINQAGRILDFEGPNKADVKFNSEWHSKLSEEDFLKLASHVTAQQTLERDFFQERLKSEKPIYLHEFLYPLIQGYDSVAMGVDLEVGGNDQLFNMLVGRTLMKDLKNKEKFVLTTKLLEDPTGAKMGKTEGNVINMTDSAENIFGKVMAFPDSMLSLATELLTDLPVSIIDKLGPMQAKKKLAYDVTTQIHGVKEAEKAHAYFEKTFQKRETPEEIISVNIAESHLPLLDLVFATHLASSRSEAKRLINQKAIDIDGQEQNDPAKEIEIPDKGLVVRVGKVKFVKVVIK